MLNNPTQKLILSNISFFKEAPSYSQIKNKKGLKDLENDLFNYHLQQLVKKGFLNKKEGKYLLTQLGKSIVTNLDHVSKQITKYKVSVYVCPVVNKKILLTRRLRHPQYGYVGMISGKMSFGEKILDAAKRELKEETNLEPASDLKIIGNLHQIRKNEKREVMEDGVFYVCYCNKVKGVLRKKDKEGEYFWVDLEEVKNIKKIFKPSVEFMVNHIKKNLNKKNIPLFIKEFEPEPEEY